MDGNSLHKEITFAFVLVVPANNFVYFGKKTFGVMGEEVAFIDLTCQSPAPSQSRIAHRKGTLTSYTSAAPLPTLSILSNITNHTDIAGPRKRKRLPERVRRPHSPLLASVKESDAELVVVSDSADDSIEVRPYSHSTVTDASTPPQQPRHVLTEARPPSLLSHSISPERPHSLSSFMKRGPMALDARATSSLKSKYSDISLNSVSRSPPPSPIDLSSSPEGVTLNLLSPLYPDESRSRSSAFPAVCRPIALTDSISTNLSASKSTAPRSSRKPASTSGSQFLDSSSSHNSSSSFLTKDTSKNRRTDVSLSVPQTPTLMHLHFQGTSTNLSQNISSTLSPALPSTSQSPRSQSQVIDSSPSLPLPGMTTLMSGDLGEYQIVLLGDKREFLREGGPRILDKVK